ncbi:LOW QUALITY PROTEIN: uncharacterized protein C6orf62 homolog [Amphiura filiformis]|uniref:LOW QUALITY PROTEIN: uncharacterized protein C6orf62 homolog n=1 Tax=Amphiura filiformis TaxID=82378 RepID=UPI003B20C428
MGDPNTRKKLPCRKLRAQLKKKKESLADQFEFKMYIIFRFKDEKKDPAVFEVEQVMPVMTNNYEESMLRGVEEEGYSLESTKELIRKDVVQLHAPRYQPVRKDMIGCTTEIDFFLWPRRDLEKIECKLFSRWKGEEDAPFKPLLGEFEYFSKDYENQLLLLIGRKDKRGLIVNNPSQSMFLFCDMHHLQTPTRKAITFKLSSLCLYLPQTELTCWAPGTMDDVMGPILPF